MKKLLATLLLLNFSFSNRSYAQSLEELRALLKKNVDPYFVNSRDTVSKYGPKCIVRDVIQDKKGNIWLASWTGIIKYDGKVFTNYTLKEDLVRFHVVSAFEDSKGNLWFGTARGGLYKYDGKSFTLFKMKDGLPDSTAICMAEDKNGNVWFGTENGVCRYNGKTFTSFKEAGSGNINSITMDKTGKMWFGGKEGITCYDGKSFSKFNDKNAQAIKDVTALYSDKKGNIWIGTFHGLALYDGKSFTEFLSKYLTYYITEDKTGNIWLSHSDPNTYYTHLPKQVLYKYDGKIFSAEKEHYEPENCQVFGKVADKDGNVWYGTMKGLCKYDGKTFTYFTK